ncbi:MAG: disulfide bond formation protein B [Ideonella sp.]|jgi:protein dithiol:quinone oxidoreductase|nr:disulfide bond formation protein B [Ideonella sp.]
MSLERADALLGASLIIALAAVGSALVSQHVYDIMPCPWCVLQRLLFMLVALAAGLGLLWRSRLGGRVGALLGLVLADLGVITALWQHFVAAQSASCNLTFADRVMSATGLDAAWPQVFAAYASCAEAKVTLMGVPYEFGSLALFVLINALLLLALVKPR